MKTTKKLLAILLTVFLLATMLPNVMADDTTSYQITIDFDYTPVEEHTFQAYQIFSGTFSTDGKLSNVDWASGVNSSGIISSLASATGVTYTTAQEVADALCTDTDSDGTYDLTAATFKAAVASNLGTAAGTFTKGTDATTSKTVYTLSGLSAGYYFISESSLSGKNDAVTAYMLQVVKNVKVTSKTGVPSLEKHVKDNNDSTGSTTDWQDSADYDVGDYIPYKLVASLNISSGNYAEYSTYSMKFTDSMCDGLTLVQDATGSTYAVKVVKSHSGTETDITSAAGVTITKADHSLVVEITNIKSSEIAATYEDKIIVYYYCQLNSNAVIGSTGNPNTAYLEFSNNPNVASEMGKTPEDENIVFTYQVTVNKVDTEDKPLAGAGFTLYKYNASSTATDKYEAIGSEQGGEGSTLTEFSWLRLDEGDYKLVETTVPDGYTKANDVVFTITATHTNDGDTNPLELTSLAGGDTFTGVVSTGTLSGKIVNKPGNTLPTTGGVGTTMFYVIGSVLVIGAFILLVAKKRANRTN